MRKILVFGLLSLELFSSNWTLKNISFQTENDADFRTDRDYTYGSEISALFQKEKNKLISFSIAHQMFTPNDFDEEDKDFSNERPYAGYMYVGTGLHTIKENTLSSLDFQIGFVGPSVKMDRVQKFVHSIIGAHQPPGWDEQIGDELILQINYEKKWYKDLDKLFDLNSNIIYYLGGNLGNASTKGVGGIFYNIGNKKTKTFGYKRIDYRGYNNIILSKTKQTHSFTCNLWAEGSVVVRDIFLDGNSFKDSPQTVDKEIFVAKGGFGFGYTYKNFDIEYIKTFSTKEFKTQSYYHNYGSLIFSYNFN